MYIATCIFILTSITYAITKGDDSNSLLRPIENSKTKKTNITQRLRCPGHGFCMPREECDIENGIHKLGYCSKKEFICCQVPIPSPTKCGSTSNEWISTFTTPNYPSLAIGSTDCIFNLNTLPNVCALRIDFDDVVMAKSNKFTNTHKCITDSFLILNLPFAPIEPLCDLKHYSGIMFLNASESGLNHEPIKFVFLIQSKKWKVKFRVTQVNCNEITPWKNQPLCGRQLMYDAPEDENELKIQNDNSLRSKQNALIVNGVQAAGREFPWQVSIQSSDSHRCGASIISPNLLLSAAHCFAGFQDLDKLNIRLGTENATREGETLDIESIIQHYEYKPFKSHLNDITIIKLKQNLTYSSIVQPVCLPQEGYEIESGDGVVSGWGQLSGAKTETEDLSPIYLQKLTVHFLPNSECSELMDKAYSIVLGRKIHIEPVNKTQICAIADRNSTVCFGDSGGPLVRVNESDGTYTQVGVVSYGVGRCIIKHSFPVIYTRVSEFLNFISISAQT